jgi:hypothetical protein
MLMKSVQRAAIVMLAFDQDGNRKLEKEEIALALAKSRLHRECGLEGTD